MGWACKTETLWTDPRFLFNRWTPTCKICWLKVRCRMRQTSHLKLNKSQDQEVSAPRSKKGLKAWWTTRCICRTSINITITTFTETNQKDPQGCACRRVKLKPVWTKSKSSGKEMQASETSKLMSSYYKWRLKRIWALISQIIRRSLSIIHQTRKWFLARSRRSIKYQSKICNSPQI